METNIFNSTGVAAHVLMPDGITDSDKKEVIDAITQLVNSEGLKKLFSQTPNEPETDQDKI